MERQNVVSVSHSNSLTEKIGIIAGRGQLPLRLAKSLTARGIPVFVLLVKNEALPDDYAQFSSEVIPITKIGKFIAALKREDCLRVTMAGPINRPNFKNIFPDKEGFKLLSKIGASLSKGDDGLLRAITQFVEDKGFEVVGAHELDEGFVAEVGTLGDVHPTAEEFKDIAKGVEVARTIGIFDIGQALVIRCEYVLGVEAAEGTEQLISRCAAFAWENPAGVLVKLPKLGQDLRTDMPTIGPDTIDQMKSAGLKGVTIESGNTLILGREELIKRANDANIFVHVIEPLNNTSAND
ncbi:MAG: UDP-2,3-diacylglucosamine diphosphatase LpxI [Sneathiella sp.]